MILAAGIGSPAISPVGPGLPTRVGHGFTCHPAFYILVGEHPAPITNDVKSFFLDRRVGRLRAETCMFPFITART